MQSPGDGLSYPVKPNTDILLPYSWPPRDPKDLGATIIERVEKEHKWDGPKLIRRDSEGYLVKEITMEDRMKMLNAENLEFEKEEAEEYERQQLLVEQQELNPDEYYYDSNSVTSDLTDIDASDDDSPMYHNRETVNTEKIQNVDEGEDGEWIDEE